LAPLRLGNVTFDCGSKCDGTNIFFSSIHPRTYDVKSSWNVANENAKLDEFGRFIHQKMAEFQQGEISVELRGFNDQCGLHMTSRAVFLVEPILTMPCGNPVLAKMIFLRFVRL